ncbi:dTMP kinase [Gardnerella sp. Marseille-Q2328]|uniref:dTMP kinase n=1 Tax=Gardnerella sp. Marseille-Q2328 TaxID=2759694 RepID=UPI0020253C7A|nr:dTMP kinase [Gardnerella sp. Marseille-Q2328]
MESYNNDFSGGCACGGNCGCGGAEAAENKGLFISFEGIDGVGKTTQVEALRNHLQSLGREVVVTREPGGTELGKSLRKILLHGSFVASRTEALLFAADRAQHVAEIIRPALNRGAVVITDRYIDSSLAYQAGGRELTMDDVRELSEWATDSLWPDRTYLLDMQPEAAFERLHRKQDRMESAGIDFARRTREAFLDLAHENEDRYRVLDATCSAKSLAELISRDVSDLIEKIESK